MNPYRVECPALVAFSGGRTSGFMLWNIIQAFDGQLPTDLHVCFCNTGLEHPSTLDFVQECSERWQVRIRWLEYRLDQCTKHSFTEVDYATASRKGEPFSLVIDQRGSLPGPVARFCSTELKTLTMERFGNLLGWEYFNVVIGLRYDEPRRVINVGKNRHLKSDACCPMFHARHTLADVEAFWKKQPFTLQIPYYQGNCQGCFLKSLSRLELVARETPQAFDWWIRQEETIVERHGEQIPKFNRSRPGYRNILKMINEQKTFAFCDNDDTLPCQCTD